MNYQKPQRCTGTVSSSKATSKALQVFPETTRDFAVEVDLIAEMVSINPFDFFVEPDAAHYPFRYDSALAVELHPYLEIKESGPRLTELVRQSVRDKIQMS